MKHKIKDYATALSELIMESNSDKKKFIGRFLDLLRKNNDMGKAKKIVVMTEDIILNKKDNKKVVLQMARKIKNLENLFAKKNDIVEEKINPELVAGVKIVVNGEGMPRLGGYGRGNLFVELEIKTPKKLSTKAKKLLEDLQKEL